MCATVITTHFVQFSIMSIDFTLETSSKLQKKKNYSRIYPSMYVVCHFPKVWYMCDGFPHSLDSDLMIILLGFLFVICFTVLLRTINIPHDPQPKNHPVFKITKSLSNSLCYTYMIFYCR